MLYSQDCFLRPLGLRWALGQKHASLSDSGGTITVGEYSEMPDLDEARRQNVQTKAAQKFLQRQCHRSDLTAVGVVLIAEGDRAAAEIQSLYSAVGESDPVSVAAQIRQNRLRTSKRTFGVNDPFVATEVTQPAGKDNRV